ncbi:MAG: TolC family protein [Magnetococcales bacterium]|nr:TolC family protein [Magnetococcales bacterium]
MLCPERSGCHLFGIVLFLVAGLGLSGVAEAAESHAHGQVVGASVADLLTLAKKMNPELLASRLDADAAAARVAGAGVLPNPKLQMTLEDVSKNRDGLPGRVATEKFLMQQELPWWGKRDSQRTIAEAENREALGKLADVEADIALRIKTAYADYHRVHLTMDQTEEWIQIMRTLVRMAQFRYAQNRAMQSEVTTAEAERGALEVDKVRLGKERSRIRARLNALVNRAPDAPIVEHPELRPLPAAEILDYAKLLERALRDNPVQSMVAARADAVDENQRLVEKGWYPDITLGMGLVQRRNPEEKDSFEAQVELTLPVPWDGYRARQREAVARNGAVQAQLQAEHVRIASTLKENLLSLEEAREVAQVTENTLMPQARMALQSALKSYQTGSTESVAVLDAAQRLKKFQIDWLKAQFEAQIRLAEVERLIGGDL